MNTSTRGYVAASTCALLIFLAIYGPSTGLGFISDDYVWIRHGQVHTPADVGRVFSTSVGLYRPLVSLSFGFNYAISGLSPRPFGFTNLAMALVCAAGIWRLGRELRLSSGLAATAAALWAFNFHGINMGVLWLSGRSGLMLTMFGVLAGIAFLRGRLVWATLAALAAAFSKEEGAMLPVLFTLWALMTPPGDGSSGHAPPVTERIVAALKRTWSIWGAIALVLAARIAAGGFFPSNAPDFYTPVFGPMRLLRNVLEYADRSLTFAAAAVLLTWLWTRRRPEPTAHDRHVLQMAAVWFVCGFALNVFLPVRSSLYAMFPGVGSALAAATCIGMLTRTLDDHGRQRLAWAGVVLLAALSPVYLHAMSAGPSSRACRPQWSRKSDEPNRTCRPAPRWSLPTTPPPAPT